MDENEKTEEEKAINEDIVEAVEQISSVTKKIKKRQTNNVIVSEYNLERISKLKGFFEEESGSNKNKEIIDYVVNQAINSFIESDVLKNKINDILKSE